MRVLLSTYGSRADAEPIADSRCSLRALGAKVRVCAPPDFAELLARVGMPLVPIGQPVRPLVTEECDALVATGVTPAGVWG
jgi:vancomycin aglycone glucosyltransferase